MFVVLVKSWVKSIEISVQISSYRRGIISFVNLISIND